MRRRHLLYVAAPYTRPDPVENTHRAIRVATAIYEQTTWVPIVPHLSLLWHAVTPRPVEWWYEYDLHLLKVCDAIVRLPGESTGADRELEVAFQSRQAIIPFEDLPRLAQAEWWTW